MAEKNQNIKQRINQALAGSAAFILIFSFVFAFLGAVFGIYLGPEIVNDFRDLESFFTEETDTDARKNQTSTKPSTPALGIEKATTRVVKEASPSVVSVLATRDLSFFERSLFPGFRQEGTRHEQSVGTGFVAAEDIIVTNKHVVADKNAEYTVVTSEEEKLDAEVVTRDPVEDLAILKVENLNLSPLELGDSSNAKPGQFVIAIGNALGEFRNTVSAGVVSGVSRTLTAGGSLGQSEVLREVIQTDAAINLGNSGGPLLNLRGEVIGINVAKAGGAAENIGFAIPINRIKNSLEQIEERGEVQYPFLGVRYIVINPGIQELNRLPYDYGALIVRGQNPGNVAVVPGSAADKAGITENDIILEVEGEKVTEKNPLDNILSKYKPGDRVELKVYQEGEEKDITVTLDSRD